MLIAVMLFTEWGELKKLQSSDFTKLMRNLVLIDGRRIYDPEKFSKEFKLRAIELGRLSGKDI